MADQNKILELYLTLLFDHPEMDDLWKAVVSIYPSNDPDNPFTPHAAAQRTDDLVRCIAARRNRRANNTYICQSALAEPKSETNRDGYPKISRTVKNARMIKSLYVDVDIAKNGCYATPADAEAGLRKFLADAKMPDPTMQVYTGSGGFHIYWVLYNPLTIEEWQPLAEALKACAKHHGFLIDMAITADPVRILRVPTTLNHKWAPPTECVLNMSSSFQCHTKVSLEQALQPYLAKQQASQSAASVGPRPQVSAAASAFTAGVGDSVAPVPVDMLATVCPATADILARGGNGDAEPLWNLALLLASFTTDPKDAAHRMSSADPRYTPAGTDAKLQQKLDARAANPRIGWPSCQQFNALHPACKTCPFLAQGKSPFHFVQRTPGAQPATPKSTTDPLMPEGYWRNMNDHVFTQTEHGPVDVLGYPIFDGGINPKTNLLVVQFGVSGRKPWGEIEFAQQTPQKWAEAWTRGTNNQVLIKDNKLVRDFTVSWVKHLQATRATKSPEAAGWHGDSFVFGGIRYTPAGQELAYRGSTTDPKFDRKGDLQPWLDALQLVRGNIPLEIAVASAFASPLVHLSGANSVVLSLHSDESGHGKSTALFIAQAVWGHPILGMSILDDTENSVLQKMQDLRHLPIYWDELKLKEQVEKLVRLVFATTQGKGKQRLTTDIKFARVDAFRTLFAIASNISISGKVIRATPGSDAGGVRVFEIEASQKIGNTLSITDSNRIKQPLEDNYGNAGAVYAEYLVTHTDQCRAIVSRIEQLLDAEFMLDKRERIWLGTMATITAGAYIGRLAGLLDFDVDAILAYLKQRFVAMRMEQTTSAYSMLSATADADDVLVPLLSDLRGVHMVQTDFIGRARPGRPTTPGQVYHNDPDRLKDVWLQEGVEDGKILARITPFDEWLEKHSFPHERVMKLLEQKYVVTKVRMTVGTGIHWLTSTRQAWCYLLEPKQKPVPRDAPPQRS